jgi:HlyD family secretion protein
MSAFASVARRFAQASDVPETPPALPTGSAWTSTEPWIAYGRNLVGVLVLAAIVMSFLSLSGAVVSQGTVGVEGSYKTMQHLDGGIVAQIPVKNGDHVSEGDLLVKLDDTQIKSQLAIIRGRLADALIQKARLEAERDEKPEFAPPAALTRDLADPQVARMLEAQRTLFLARRMSHTGEQGVLRQRVAQIQTDFAGIERQHIARTRELEITSRELKGVLPLFEKGFVNQQRLSPLQRDTVRLEGEVARLAGETEKLKSGLVEAELRLAQSEREFQAQVAEELRRVQTQLTEFSEQRIALEDKLERTEIRAPRAGRVHALAPTTVGGVITPASAIAQIIPDGGKLLVDVRIQPQDIDKVRGGQVAVVKFPAFNSNRTPRLEGIVTTVSPAEIIDNSPASQGRPYFKAQIEVPPSELAKLGRDRTLVPGMPAEVFIETTPRSILSYLVKPLFDAMGHVGN